MLNSQIPTNQRPLLKMITSRPWQKLVLLVLATASLQAQQVPFDEYFLDQTLRIDYYHVGGKNEGAVILDKMYRQGVWAANPKSLIYSFQYGRYFIRLYDVTTSALIYSRGYDGYFAEYKTTDPALKGIKRAFHQPALLPFPRHPIRFVIEVRDSINLYHPIYQLTMDPNDYHIITESPRRGDQIYETVKSGNPHQKVDIVVLSEGYTASENGKFESDLKKYTEIFFNCEPYRNYRSRFNFSDVFSPSPESGVDEPRQGSYRHTLLDATYNSMDSDRYLLTRNNKTMRDMATQVPYDAILIMVNSKRYGGGALFNCFSTFTADGPWSEYVFHHEFAHAFGFIGDRYYTSDVAYNDFFPQGVEPTEPNLTALLDPQNLKWKKFVAPGLPIPTPWGQESFDSLNVALATIAKEKAPSIDRMKKERASEKEIEAVGKEYEEKSECLREEIKKFMTDHALRGKVGAFGEGGFVGKGLYRPTVNSVMNQFNKVDRFFYKVNEEVLIRIINSTAKNDTGRRERARC